MEIDDLDVVRDSIRAACAISSTAWLEFTGTIQAKGGAIVKGPKANYYQREMSAVEEYCIKHERPCRILGLKPRRGGSSTISMGMTHKNLSTKRKRAAVMGKDHTQGGNLLTMLRLMAEGDDLMEEKAEIMTEKGRYPNGSTVVQLTASNPNAGVSAGFEILIGTEVAKWSDDGVTDAEKVLSEVLKCVPNLPGTLIILESTAWGASGAFFEKCMSAITFEELKAGKDGFVLVFAPWFRFDDYVRDPKLEGMESAEDYSEKEMELAIEHKLTISQVAWMRWSIREECRRDFSIFCQDYPFDIMSAFLSSGRKRFNLAGLEKMKAEAKLPQNQPEFGVIELSSDGKPSWRSCQPDEARWMRWEKPMPGCAYNFPVDVMTGASQVGGKDPDSHGPVIWRKGYFAKDKGWVPSRVVAHMLGDWAEWQKNKRFKLWWDIDILEEQVWRGSAYYGGCIIIPEVNMDRGLIELLKLRGANIYQRELFNKREYTQDKALGWLTTTQTREMAIESLAKGIREHGRSYDGVDIHSPMILQEIESFIVRENGRSEAAGGYHDDLTLASAIGITLIDHATTYQVEERVRTLPPDLQAFMDARDSAGVTSQYS